MTLLGKTKKGSVDMVLPDPLGVGVSLAHLIERRQWSSVVARIRQDPMEAEQELQVMTRGGFTASTGMSPLHYACERKPPAEVARLLMEAFPVATLTRAMPGGCLPLHIACTWGGSAEVVKVLLAADSGSVRIKDELGNVALHSACFSGADSKVIEALLQSDGKSVLARNHQGSRPIDICKRLRHENRKVVMDMLTRKKEEIMRLHNRDGSSGVLSEIAREAEEMNQRYVVETKIARLRVPCCRFVSHRKCFLFQIAMARLEARSMPEAFVMVTTFMSIMPGALKLRTTKKAMVKMSWSGYR